MTRPLALTLEKLENREVPAVFGIPWADARHLTISFAPDGTSVDGASSNLFGMLPNNTTAWQRQILRAVQTWAQYANINVAVVADSGAALGAAGAPQGDLRFGDIRIAARPLSENVLAITAPSGFLGGTRAGDILLNSNVQFSIDGVGNGPDLYSAMLQEVGHALGMGNSADPESPMFELYSGVRTGLTGGDIANVQSLYGARTRDAFDWFGGNDTFSSAANLGSVQSHGAGSFGIKGDLTTNSDIDFYRVAADVSNPYGLSFRITVDASLLAPKITVLDANGTAIGTTQSVDPLTGALTITLANVQAGAYYFVRVEAANASFGTGKYELRFISDPNGPALASEDGLVLDDNHTDDTIGEATPLFASAGGNHRFSVTGNLQNNDVDFYRIHSPATEQSGVLTIVARGLDSGLAVRILVYNSANELVQAQVLSNENGDYIVQVANALADQDYFIRVTGASGGTGVYRLNADFGSPLVALNQIGAGTLSDGHATAFGTITANRSQLMHFVLSAGASGVPSGVRLAVFDANGHVVATLFARAGQTATATVYLGVGDFTLRFDGLTQGGAALPPLDYSLKGISLTDPIAPIGSDPGNDPNGGINLPDFEVRSFNDEYYAMLGLDSLGEVAW